MISGLLPHKDKDGLKAISSAAAAAGGVELWHGVGVTPEAPDLVSVYGGGEAITVTGDDLLARHRELSTARDGPLDERARIQAHDRRAVVQGVEIVGP